MVNISERPAEVADRAVPGHWEGDLIVGAESKSAIGTLVERTTRFVMLLHLPDGHGALAVQNAVVDKMTQLPDHLRRSLTWDQGKEMSNHLAIAEAAALDIYFCDPHSPWQRGSNENTNGLLRQYFVKGTDLSAFPADYLDFVATKLNTRPTRHWPGKHQQKPSTNYCHNRSNHPVLQPPPETAGRNRCITGHSAGSAPVDRSGGLRNAPSDGVDPPARQGLQWVDRDDHGHPAAMVEDRRSDCRYRPLLACGVVVGQKPDSGEFHQQLIGDLADVIGESVAGQCLHDTGSVGQGRRGAVHIESALPGAGQYLFEATGKQWVSGCAAFDPGLLFLCRVPRGEGDSEGRGVTDPLAGCADRPLAGVLERGDHQRIADAFDNRSGVTEFVGKIECRRSAACAIGRAVSTRDATTAIAGPNE